MSANSAMKEHGFPAKDINGNKLVLHHLGQNPAGPVVEMPAFRHNVHNRVQHPYGNAAGAGLIAEERAAFDTWWESNWKARAAEELQKRASVP